MFFKYDKIIKENSSNVFNSLQLIKKSFYNLLILKDYNDEEFKDRNDFIENVFNANNEIINNEIDKIVLELQSIRKLCYEDLDKLLVLLNINGEDSLDKIKDSSNVALILNNLNISIEEKNEIKEYSKQNEDIRFFIHQVMNILSIAKPIFVNRIFSKELLKKEIIKDNEFIISKLQTNLEQIIKFEKELSNLITINENGGEIEFNNFDINDIVKFIEIYSDKLEEFQYSGEIFKINFKLNNKTNRTSMFSNKDKIEEILDVILNNGSEELCNKEIESVSSISKEILVEINNTENTLNISINDNGRGIPSIDKIFEPYYTTKANTGSSGIGLAAAKRIINYLKGDLKVTTKENEGSSFIISLPL